MNEDLILLRAMPWKHKVVVIVLIISNIIIGLCIHELILFRLKCILLSFVLLTASYIDFRIRRIPDWIHLLVIIIGFINFNGIDSISGLILTPLPLLLTALYQEGSIGGGDIKLISSMGFTTGFVFSINIIILTCIFALIFFLVYYQYIRKSMENKIPLVPFISFAWLVLECIS